MRKFFVLLSFIPCSIFAQQKQLDSLFAAQKDFSAVVLIAENESPTGLSGRGRPVYQKAFGFREFASQTPLHTTDIFELASVSKQFTAMIIMMLQEKGLLNYDDLVEKFMDIPYKGISIRHLLTHTSGLPDYQQLMDKHWDKTKVAGNADCIEYLNKYAPPKLFEPGTKYEYSNTAYLILASIAEKASGKDFIEMCRQWIFKKLKMKSTDIRTLEEKKATPNFAIGHIYVKARNQPALPAGRYIRADSFPSSDYTIWLGNRKGPGRISSTTTDLLKWDQALYSEKLITQSTLQEAFTPMKLNDGSLSNYGFGWMLKTDSTMGRVVYHTGDNPGYKTQIIRFIDKNKTIILLNNNAHANFEIIIKSIEDHLKSHQ